MKIIVFDIGGTWTRSAIYNLLNHSLEKVKKYKTKNYLSQPDHSSSELQQDLVDQIIETVSFYQAGKDDRLENKVSISLGAAINGHTGEVLNSGPLWGPACPSFNLKAKLSQERPDIDWHVLNDITALLLAHLKLWDLTNRNIALFTISTGIGCRIYDALSHNPGIHLDKHTGIQGEIGHIPILYKSSYNYNVQKCDCGGISHLNAYCSGRGIENLLKYHSMDIEKFTENLRKREVEAIKLLDEFTLPIAEMIIYLLTFLPQIDLVILTGGCVHKLSPHYINSLINNLMNIGMYQITTRVDNYFQEKLILGNESDDYGLVGAGEYVRNNSQLRK